MSIVLLDDCQIREVHRHHLGADSVTDVITFRFSPVPGDEESPAGEILVNVERAVEEGTRRPGGAARELALYVAHGMDHLSGADDSTPEKRRRMRRRELRWLASADTEQLIHGLI